MTCIFCNSENDGIDCLQNATKQAFCESNSGQCYIYSKDGVLRRGCVGDSVVENVQKCYKSMEECSICSNNDLCNDRDVEEQYCHVLSPKSKEISKSVHCPITARPMGCFIRVNETTHETTKGCVASLTTDEKILCASNGDECKVCSDDNCNHRDYFMECVQCQSGSTSCLEPDVDTSTKKCRILNSDCFTRIVSGGTAVERGCLSDGYEGCADDDLTCEKCSDAVCNINALKNSCVSCDSYADPDCEKAPHLSNKKICTVEHPLHSNASACYMFQYQSDRVYRGCFSDLAADDQKNCNSASKNCQTCNGTDCNKRLQFQQTCYSCNSTITPSCVQSHNDKTVKCPNYSSACLTGIDEVGATQRGCSAPNDAKRYSQGFQLCFDDKCNSQTYPVNRHHCYQCAGPSCNFENGANETFIEPCKNYVKSNKCFALYDKGNFNFSSHFYVKII